jgi:hypothetical protein
MDSVHEQDHHHAHAHAHVHAPHGHATPSRPPASLLRMSALRRLALSGGAVAAIWVGVFWAIG